MKIFLLRAPLENNFASIAVVGTWSEGELCKSCRSSNEQLIEPLQIEFEPGSDVISDFSYDHYKIVIKTSVFNYMIEKKYECSYGKVEVLPFSEKKRKCEKIVKFPYQGPELLWLRPNDYIGLNENLNNLQIRYECSLCKKKVYDFQTEGLVIDKKDWKNQKMFSISEFKGATYLTEIGLELLLSQNFTNLNYVESGMIK